MPRNAEIPANADPTNFDMGICSRADHPLPDSAQFCGMFKTPTLRNVAIRKVFFHNGKMKSLREVLHFYNTRDTQPELWYPTVNGVVQKFDDLPAQYQANIDPQGPLDGRPAGSQPPMTEQDLDDLEAFLDTLTDADVVNQVPAAAGPYPRSGRAGPRLRSARDCAAGSGTFETRPIKKTRPGGPGSRFARSERADLLTVGEQAGAVVRVAAGGQGRRQIATPLSRRRRPRCARLAGSSHDNRAIPRISRDGMYDAPEEAMNRRIIRRRVWTVVLASGLAPACGGGSPPQTALPPVCTAAPLSSDVVLPDQLSPAQGSVTGSELTARLCDGGASASMYRTSATTSPPNQLQLSIDSFSSDPTMDFDVALPTDATKLQLAVVIGPSAAEAGTYTETTSTCGLIDLCAFFPVPASATCVNEGDVCSPGCTFDASGTTCVPVAPETCWRASAAPCGGGVWPTAGSWRLTLSSVAPYSDTYGYELWVTHGSLDATVVKIDSTGAIATPTSTATLSLSF